MYHPNICQYNISKLESAFNIPGGLKEYSISEVEAWTGVLAKAVDDKGKQVRQLSRDEQAFITNELLMSKCSFTYWAERYAYINLKGAGIGRLSSFNTAQRFILSEISRIEWAIYQGERDDGLLFNLLKARQEGGSTLAELLLAHRVTTQNHVFGLIASDVPGSSSDMFGIFERVVENLPWWLTPTVTEHVKNQEMVFDGGSHIWVGAGKSVRGTTGERGQLGRGKSLSVIHLSELSTWDEPDQIDSALMPTMHPSPRLLGILESTAKGRGNWHHREWKNSCSGISRFLPIFVPWFAEPTMYSRRAPVNWSPSYSTLAHAKQCEGVGLKWLKHTPSLTREQLYWYETTRASFEGKEALSKFLEEYAADPEDCFQHSGRSIFPPEVITRIKDQARPARAVLEIAPASEIQKRASDFQLREPLIIPPGYGLRVVPNNDLVAIINESSEYPYLDYLVIWELPKSDSLYIMSVDVSEGIGKDRSIIDITRVATISSPDEQVAQFASASIDPVDLASYCDVIGRLYTGSDHQEALAAIEINNHGLATQSELQRHLGYNNFFVWQYEEKADESRKYSSEIGWRTTRKTRPYIIIRYVKKLKSIDPMTGYPDYRINSLLTIDELRDFQTETTIGEAAACKDAHDDCIMAGCIGVHVAQLLHYEQGEPIDDQRRRLSEERRRRDKISENLKTRRDYANTDCTLEEMTNGDPEF